MEEIVVPAPPKEAFNKHRRISDLIRKQVEHFKHLEHRLRAEERTALPQHAIVTEDDAARYIASMTRLLLANAKAPAAKKKKPLEMRKTKQAEAKQPEEGLALAASARPSRSRKAAAAKKHTAKRKK